MADIDTATGPAAGTGGSLGSRPATGRPTGSTAADAKDEVKQKAEDAKQKADEFKAEAKQKAESVAEDLKEAGKEKVAEQKEAVAERIGRLSSAVRSAGQSLRENNEEQFGELGESFADELDRMQGYLERNDVRGLLGDLEDLGRRRPAFFLGGMVAAGAMVGRFLRATPPEEGNRSAEDRAAAPPAGHGYGRSAGVPPRPDTTTGPTSRQEGWS